MIRRKLKRYHHFKGNDLSPSERVQRRVVELLINSKIHDSERESSVIFELKHSCECIQIARILAQKRGLNIELSETAAALHDIYVIAKGRYKDHGKLGASMAENILREIGGFSAKEIATICKAVKHHSEKDIYSDDPYSEVIKDTDVFDCSLIENSIDEYKLTKSQSMVREYIKRVKKVRRELGLPTAPVFRK